VTALQAHTHLDSHLDRPLDSESYKTVFRQHPAGVAVVTLRDPVGNPLGFTATSVISVSAAPPLLAFSIASTSSSWPALSRAATLVVSFLAEDQDDVAARFATSGIDRFAAGGWSRLPTGEPVIEGALTRVRGRVLQRTAAGGSFLVSVLALDSDTRPGSSPLVYHDRSYHRLSDDTAI
jgi:flavin reductase (DIM6/NTAB) family NADH-FMN oxidoreductase RutF